MININCQKPAFIVLCNIKDYCCVINSSRCNSRLIIVAVVLHHKLTGTNQKFVLAFTHIIVAGYVCHLVTVII